MHTVNYNYNDTANHCNFNIVGGESTGTYSYETGFYGLSEIPAATNYTYRPPEQIDSLTISLYISVQDQKLTMLCF